MTIDFDKQLDDEIQEYCADDEKELSKFHPGIEAEIKTRQDKIEFCKHWCSHYGFNEMVFKDQHGEPKFQSESTIDVFNVDQMYDHINTDIPF